MRKSKMTSIYYIALMIILIVAVLFKPINKTLDVREVTVTVIDKAVKNDKKTSRYLVYTKDASGDINTFEVTDSLLMMRFDSSDVYAQILVGETYTFTVRGLRIKIFSCYPNIYEVLENKN